MAVQLAIADPRCLAKVREALERKGSLMAVSVTTPDLTRDGVVVIDHETLARVSRPLPHPERFVLITRNDPALLARAWETGIVSVVFESDPPETLLLSILSAGLRAQKACHTGRRRAC